MNTASPELTLAADPQESQNRDGSSRRGLTYPSRAELLVRGYKMKGTPAERIRRAYIIEATGCWRWIRGITSSGYGHFSINSIYYQAHKIVYIIEAGPLPEGLEPDHLCRNRWCVNPAHLEFVTHAVNVQRGGNVILSQEQVDAIRLAQKAGESMRSLGRRFGVDHAQIHRIVHETSWRPEPPIEKVVAA